MVTARESRVALQLVTSAAVSGGLTLLNSVSGSVSQKRSLLLDATPEIIAYYSDGSAALAADFYDDQREIAAPPKLFVAEPVVSGRTKKIFNATAWATAPLLDDDHALAASRLADVIQLESSRPFRDTILANRRRDPSAVGWRRVTSGGCKMCLMLAARGAVYTDQTARFAAHPHCKCTAQPVFSTDDFGEEASVMQYMASRRRRTPAQQARLRNYLNENF